MKGKNGNERSMCNVKRAKKKEKEKEGSRRGVIDVGGATQSGVIIGRAK
jgi:hypothetical protein